MSNVIVFTLFISIYLLLIWKAGETFPLLYLFLFTFFIQYVFSTHLIYSQYGALRKQMPIGEDQLFAYILPALLSLFLGVFIFNRDFHIRNLIDRIDKEQAFVMGCILLTVSYGLDIAPLIGITALKSILSFTSYLKYIAAFCFLFTDFRLKYPLVVFIFGQLALVVLQTGVFMDLINWATYLFFIVSLKFRISFIFRASFIFIAVPILLLIQSVKDEYRSVTWSNKREAGLSLFTELAQKRSEKDADNPFAETRGVVNTVGRLNQGWHLGMVLKRVPLKEPFSNGAEMKEDVIASFLPRLFFEDKKNIHTREKFYKYTGHKLSKKTAMTIGILGDFYVNFGRVGSFVMLFIFGALVARLLYIFMTRYVLPDPINIVWIPYMFTYLIRADNDFYTLFNGIVKGFIIFLVINLIRKQLWVRRRVKVTQ